MRKHLPISEPPIIGYMHHLYPLSILARDTAYLPWFYCHCIQLRQFEGRGLNFYLHPFYREFVACPLLESNWARPTALPNWIRISPAVRTVFV